MRSDDKSVSSSRTDQESISRKQGHAQVAAEAEVDRFNRERQQRIAGLKGKQSIQEEEERRAAEAARRLRKRQKELEQMGMDREQAKVMAAKEYKLSMQQKAVVSPVSVVGSDHTPTRGETGGQGMAQYYVGASSTVSPQRENAKRSKEESLCDESEQAAKLQAEEAGRLRLEAEQAAKKQAEEQRLRLKAEQAAKIRAEEERRLQSEAAEAVRKQAGAARLQANAAKQLRLEEERKKAQEARIRLKKEEAARLKAKKAEAKAKKSRQMEERSAAKRLQEEKENRARREEAVRIALENRNATARPHSATLRRRRRQQTEKEEKLRNAMNGIGSTYSADSSDGSVQSTSSFTVTSLLSVNRNLANGTLKWEKVFVHVWFGLLTSVKEAPREGPYQAQETTDVTPEEDGLLQIIMRKVKKISKVALEDNNGNVVMKCQHPFVTSVRKDGKFKTISLFKKGMKF